MKNALSIFFKKYLPKIIFVSLLCTVCVLPVTSQSAGNENFPQGSTNGTTEMNNRVTGVDFPNISINATSPQTGKQVAFSVQLLLLLSLLTLAPSLLVLMTCFLRFSIVLDFIASFLIIVFVASSTSINTNFSQCPKC